MCARLFMVKAHCRKYSAGILIEAHIDVAAAEETSKHNTHVISITFLAHTCTRICFKIIDPYSCTVPFIVRGTYVSISQAGKRNVINVDGLHRLCAFLFSPRTNLINFSAMQLKYFCIRYMLGIKPAQIKYRHMRLRTYVGYYKRLSSKKYSPAYEKKTDLLLNPAWAMLCTETPCNTYI